LENAMKSISVGTLFACLEEPRQPILIDVRRNAARQASGMTMAGAIWRDPAHWLDWKDEVAAMAGPIVFFCVHGHEVSQGLTAALCAMGVDAKYLEGGFSEWQKFGQTVPCTPSLDDPSWGGAS
jgi:rhodanese-related sulfurtransferase